MHAARGEIIAYTDSDCAVDPHWLTLMVRAMMEGKFDGCGGPNYAPHEDGRVEACVAASPGAPCHVLVGESRRASGGMQHGFHQGRARKPAASIRGSLRPATTLTSVGGCSIRVYGSATVPRLSCGTSGATRSGPITDNSAVTDAPRRCCTDYPERFNALGQIKWRGTIPGLIRTLPGGAATGFVGRVGAARSRCSIPA